MLEQRWRQSPWVSQAHAWIDARLAERGIARTGAIEQPHVYPWSTVMRVPTEAGAVWFKANDEATRHEAVVVERIAARRPDVLSEIVAVDRASGWMLMADAGETLRVIIERERDLDRWLRVLPRYAELQLDLAADVDELVAQGVPDRRLVTLPKAYEQLMEQTGAEPRFRDAAPLVADLCARLGAFGLPELLQHDDLHDAQVFVHDGRYLLLDWGDSCVSHPFFSLSVTLEGGLAWGLDDVENSVDTAPFRDAYLQVFAQRLGRTHEELVEASRVAVRLGWACRAVNGHVPGDDDRTFTRLRMFLDGRP